MYEIAPPYRHEVYSSIENEAFRVEADIRRRVDDGKIFSCMFMKRTNKHFRRMVGRLGVKYTEPGDGRSRGWDPSEHQLLQVFDMQKGQFRFINLPKAIWLKAGGDLIVYNHDLIFDYPELSPNSDVWT